MDLSFIPLMLLSLLSCYVGFLWLTPVYESCRRCVLYGRYR